MFGKRTTPPPFNPLALTCPIIRSSDGSVLKVLFARYEATAYAHFCSVKIRISFGQPVEPMAAAVLYIPTTQDVNVTSVTVEFGKRLVETMAVPAAELARVPSLGGQGAATHAPGRTSNTPSAGGTAGSGKGTAKTPAGMPPPAPLRSASLPGGLSAVRSSAFSAAELSAFASYHSGCFVLPVGRVHGAEETSLTINLLATLPFENGCYSLSLPSYIPPELLQRPNVLLEQMCEISVVVHAALHAALAHEGAMERSVEGTGVPTAANDVLDQVEQTALNAIRVVGGLMGLSDSVEKRRALTIQYAGCTYPLRNTGKGGGNRAMGLVLGASAEYVVGDLKFDAAGAPVVMKAPVVILASDNVARAEHEAAPHKRQGTWTGERDVAYAASGHAVRNMQRTASAVSSAIDDRDTAPQLELHVRADDERRWPAVPLVLRFTCASADITCALLVQTYNYDKAPRQRMRYAIGSNGAKSTLLPDTTECLSGSQKGSNGEPGSAARNTGSFALFIAPPRGSGRFAVGDRRRRAPLDVREQAEVIEGVAALAIARQQARTVRVNAAYASTDTMGGGSGGFQNSAARQLDLLLPGAGASLLPTAASANAQEASDDIALIVNLRRRKQLRPGEKHPETAPFRRAIVIVLDRSASMRQGGVATALVTTLKGALYHLDEADKFALVTFDDSVSNFGGQGGHSNSSVAYAVAEVFWRVQSITSRECWLGYTHAPLRRAPVRVVWERPCAWPLQCLTQTQRSMAMRSMWKQLLLILASARC